MSIIWPSNGVVISSGLLAVFSSSLSGSMPRGAGLAAPATGQPAAPRAPTYNIG
jgi:hypothetical protein